MSVLLGVLVVVGGAHLLLAFLAIASTTSRWWTEYGITLGFVGLVSSLIAAVGVLPSSSILDASLRQPTMTLFVHLIPLFVALYAIFWFIFVGRYIDMLTAATENIFAIIAIPIIVAMPLGTTWTELTGGIARPISILTALPPAILKISAYVAAPLHFGIALIATAALFWGVYQYRTPTISFSIALFLGGPIWYFANYVAAPVFGLQSEPFYAISGTAGLVSLAGVAVVYTTSGLDEQRPPANSIGRNAVIEELDDPVVVLDDNWTIIDVNPDASRLLGPESRDLIGDRVTTVLPSWVETDLEDGTDEFEVTLEDNRTYVVSVSTVSSGRGRYLGKTLVFRDVTARQQRKQQIQVLNRVLRHNLRNEGTVILGYTNVLQDRAEYDPDYVGHIQDGVERLVELGDRTRTVTDMMAANPIQEPPVTLAEVVEKATDRIAFEDAPVTVENDLPGDVDVRSSETILVPVVAEALRNAVRHGDDSTPTVTLLERGDGETDLRFAVSDTGPGIPREEVAVVRDGEETPLEHGSGIGLWLLEWGATRLGGTVSFHQRDPDGTRVEFELPAEHVATDE